MYSRMRLTGSQEIFKNIATVAGGVNGVVSAGAAIKNAFTDKTPTSRINLGSTMGNQLGQGQAFNPTNLAQSLTGANGYGNLTGGGNGGGGGAPAGGGADLNRQHYATLMQLLGTYKG
jgi:hypothetical protein